MDNFNLQKFVKKSKNEFYTNLYEGKKKHSMEEEMHDDDHKMEEKMHDDDHKMEENHQSLDPEVADRIEGLLNIPMKAKFINTGVNLINDFLQDEVMDVEDVISHLANELTKEYHTAADHSSAVALEGEIADEMEDEFYDGEHEEKKDLTNEVSMNASDLETAMALLSGILGLPAVAVLSQKAQDKLKALKGKEALKEEEGDEEIEVEDEIETPETSMDMDVDMDMSTPSEEPDNKEVFSQLVDAYEAAKELGDEKLTRQLANTITYFNKTIIFGDEE